MSPTTTDMAYVKAPGMTHVTTILDEDDTAVRAVHRSVLLTVGALWDRNLHTDGVRPITVDEVADLLGIAQPTISRVLAYLVHQEYLEKVDIDVELGWGWVFRIPQDVRTPAPKEN